jgi:lantibiotic modifying enzyme
MSAIDGFVKQTTSLAAFFRVLYMKKYLHGYLKNNKYSYFYRKFSCCQTHVKPVIKYHRFTFLKSVPHNLMSKSKKFWKCVSSFGKNKFTSVQLDVGDNYSGERNAVVNAFAEHFQSASNNPSLQRSS